MAKPEEIQDTDLRAQIEKAYQHMREGQGTDAVKILADAYLYQLNHKPDMLEETIEPRPGRKMPAVMRWPNSAMELTRSKVWAEFRLSTT